MDARLIRCLIRAGKDIELLKWPDGTELLLTPYGGRVLGLFAPGDTQNFYWVNPALFRVGSARAFFKSEQWQNTGGERSWLGPEADYFFPRYPDLSLYQQPRPLDGGTFRILRKSGSLGLAINLEVTSHRHRQTMSLLLTKWVEPAPNPLRAEQGFPMPRGVRFAGYTIRAGLELTEKPPASVPVGLWSLTQLPHGGEMIIPTYGRARPLVFFGQVPRGDLRIRRSLVRYRLRSPGEHKIGLRAYSTTGRIGYYHESSGSAQLVVRNFFGNPSGDYVDYPNSNPADPGYGVQGCNVSNAALGSFAELEYHVPAIGIGGKSHVEDVAQVWAYRGTRIQIARIADLLLGINLSRADRG